MQTDFLIIGQGISGTFLSWFLKKAGVDFHIIDEFREDVPSRVAAGLINPVTGRRVVKTWKIDELLPFCKNEYTLLGDYLGISGIKEQTIIDFFPNADVRNSFKKKTEEGLEYIHMNETEDFHTWFNYELGYGVITPSYIANLKQIIPYYRNKLIEEGKISEEVFDSGQVKISNNKIEYKNITARYLIFCDGTHGYFNPWFGALPFALNKGEALIIKIPGLPKDYTYKKTNSIIHIYEDYFWVGGSYEWEFKDSKPTAEFLINIKRSLDRWLKLPYEVTQQLAAIRPATVERRPFAGMHPKFKNLGILNGMGTKGCSLAPYLAKELADNLLYGRPIDKEALVNRFDNLLLKNLTDI